MSVLGFEATAADRFTARLQEHRGILYRIAAGYAFTPSDREDLTQEIVAELWRSFPRYDEQRPFSTWLYRVALNTAISFARRESRRQRRIVAAEDAILDTGSPLVESEGTDENVRTLWRFINELGELDRALLLLHLDGNRHSVVGEVLGISESNVGTKLTRIRDRLRQQVAASN